MFCKNCGKSIEDGTVQCPHCGQNLQDAVRPEISIKTHLTEAVLVTLFCCLPFGIVAIVNAAKVSNLVAAGKYNEAVEASNNASKWVKISLIVGIIANLLAFVFNFLGAALAN